MKRPRVAFVLPATSRTPIGGHKEFYEYANALAEDGYETWVVHSFTGNGWPRPFSAGGLCRSAKVFLRSAWHRWKGWHRQPAWFRLNPRVRYRVVWSLKERHLPPADIYVFSEALSVAQANRYHSIPLGRIVHFVQGHETWTLVPEELAALYRAPTHKIVISGWLKREVEKAGGRAAVVPNFIDFASFRMMVLPEARDARVVGMLFHVAPGKDVETGIRALELAQSREPALRARLFGVFPMERELPPWMRYCRNPTREQLLEFYNGIAIFLGTSRQEGWGLTVGEAMACGAAVVCTDNGGYAEMAVDGETARVVPVGNAERMAEGILELVRDDALRVRLAHAGHRFISAFTRERSVRLLERQLQEAFDGSGDAQP